MAGLFKLIWNSPVHKEALKIEAQFVSIVVSYSMHPLTAHTERATASSNS
jgi:hypothetical protein